MYKGYMGIKVVNMHPLSNYPKYPTVNYPKSPFKRRHIIGFCDFRELEIFKKKCFQMPLSWKGRLVVY